MSGINAVAALGGGLDRGTRAAGQALGRPLDPHDPAVIRRTAAQMVSETAFVPLLAEMRAFPFGEQYGHGGRGESVFAQQLDLRIADAVAAADRGGLAAQIARRLEAATAARTAAAPVRE